MSIPDFTAEDAQAAAAADAAQAEAAERPVRGDALMLDGPIVTLIVHQIDADKIVLR